MSFTTEGTEREGRREKDFHALFLLSRPLGE